VGASGVSFHHSGLEPVFAAAVEVGGNPVYRRGLRLGGWGLNARKHPPPQAGGEKCLLTFPFIGLPKSPTCTVTPALTRLPVQTTIGVADGAGTYEDSKVS